MNSPVYPFAFSCWKKSWAFEATCLANTTTFAFCATAWLASDVKSVCAAGCDWRDRR